MARIAVLRQYYFPQDIRVRREVDALLGAGHEVEVICLARAGEPHHERRGRLTVWRLPMRHRRAGATAYVAEHAAFLVAAGTLLALRHLRRRFDVVQANSIPDSVLFAALVPRLMGARLVLDLHETMPEFLATRFGTTAEGLGVRAAAAVEQTAIRLADATLTCTEPMRRAFAGRGADAARVHVVHNAADERIFRADGHVPDHDPRDEFRLICHGAIEERYGHDTVLRAMALLRDDMPHLRFRVFGEGSEKRRFQQLATELGVADRVWWSDGLAPMHELIRGIAQADAGVVAMKRDAFRDLTHCNKMFEFFAMRRPVITSWTRSVAEYFDDEAVEFFTADDPEDLARAIRRLHADPARRAALVDGAARESEPLRWARQRELYLSLIDDVVAV
jgi:glycosyltransferase involved in cell wall biosynthesis